MEVKWLALLLRTLNVTGSNPEPVSDYRDKVDQYVRAKHKDILKYTLLIYLFNYLFAASNP